MQERRKETRKNLMAYTQVFDLYGGFLLGYLSDLTLKGAMIICDRAIEENNDITLGIELPELPAVKSSRVTIAARALWCQQDISPEFFNVGFEFKDVTDEQGEVIQAIIDNYEFRRDVPPNYPIKPSPGK